MTVRRSKALRASGACLHVLVNLRDQLEGSQDVILGVLENLVMVGGTTILGVLALVIYGLSAAALALSERRDEAVWHTP